MIDVRKLILFPVCFLVFFSCKKDIDELNRIKDRDFTVVDWEPTFVASILDTRTTLGELFVELDTVIKDLEDDSLFLSINEDNLLVATYRYPFMSGLLDSYYRIEDHQDQFEVVIPQEKLDIISSLPVGVPLSPSLFDTVLVFDINPQYNALLELVELSGGEISIDYNHNFNQNVGVDITVRSITEKNTNDTVDFQFSGFASAPDETQQVSLTNHIVDLLHEGLPNKLEIYVALTGDIINPNLTGDRFTINFTIGGYKIDFVRGDLGEFETQIPSDEFRFDIFDQLDVPGIHLKSPSISLNIKSTLGIPMDVRIDEFSVGFRDNTTESLGLEGDIIRLEGVNNRFDIPNNPWVLDPPYTIENSSVLNDALSTKPNKLFYSFNASSDPNEEGLVDFFMADSSHIAVDLVARIPFDFTLDTYTRSDVVELSIGDSLGSFGEDEDSLIDLFEKAQLKLVIENQLPFEVEIQGFLVDSSGDVLGQVFEDDFYTVLANNNIDNNGKALAPEEITVIVELDQEKFGYFVDASNIIIESTVKTSGTNDVKLLSDYQFGVRGGVLAKFRVPVDIEKKD